MHRHTSYTSSRCKTQLVIRDTSIIMFDQLGKALSGLTIIAVELKYLSPMI